MVFLKPRSNKDTTVFGTLVTGSLFTSDDCFLNQAEGVTGPTPDNIILIAQLTTKGDISFELNVELEEPDGATPKTIHYVANDSILIDTTYSDGSYYIERLSPFLKYPFTCGCTDTDFLEYSNEYACMDFSQCLTRIVLGCMDPSACNYNTDANFNVQELCCYPGLCGDRDIAVVCPSTGNERLLLFPNPVKDNLILEFKDIEKGEAKYSIYDSFGKLVMEKNVGLVSETFTENVNTAKLRTGLYMVRLIINKASYSKIFMKN